MHRMAERKVSECLGADRDFASGVTFLEEGEDAPSSDFKGLGVLVARQRESPIHLVGGKFRDN